MPTAFQLPNDHLNRRVIDTSPDSLLEFLCTESIYSLKDDFDKDNLSDYWGVAHGEVGAPFEGVTDFHFIDDTINGFIEGDPGNTNDMDVRLFSKHALWSPARRCVVQASFQIASLASAKFEFGFANPVVAPGDPTLDGVVLIKATPTANDVGAFAVAVLDTDDNSDLDLVVQAGAALTAANQGGGPTVSAPGPITLMVAMTEGGGTRYWINGVPAGQLERPAKTVTTTFGTSGSSEAADHGPGTNMHLWFMVQNRAANVNHNMRIDYIQAWQEREAV